MKYERKPHDDTCANINEFLECCFGELWCILFDFLASVIIPSLRRDILEDLNEITKASNERHTFCICHRCYQHELTGI